jgi:hypothetical protein
MIRGSFFPLHSSQFIRGYLSVAHLYNGYVLSVPGFVHRVLSG